MKEKQPKASLQKTSYSKDSQANNAIKEALKAYNNRELVPLLPNGEKKSIRSVSKIMVSLNPLSVIARLEDTLRLILLS